MRVTRSKINKAMIEAFGDQLAKQKMYGDDNRHNIDKYALDYSPYGGYKIIVFTPGDSGDGWAESDPFGHERMPAKEMMRFLEGIMVGRGLGRQEMMRASGW